MIFTKQVPTQFDAKFLKVKAKVRYWEDAVINGIQDEAGDLTPCSDGEYWCPVIDIETGMIQDWPTGTTADIHFKVCDAGTYTLTDALGLEIAKEEGYVVNMMCPSRNGYGDYIIMTIDGQGKIQNWQVDISDFEELS